MSTNGSELPDGWQRAENTDERAGRYNAQRPLRYEHADGLELNVQPTTPNTGSTDQDVWQLNAIRDGEGRSAVEALREGIDGRDSAIETTREFMRTYNDHAGTDDPTGDAIDAFTE